MWLPCYSTENSLIISFTVFSHVNTVLMMKSASIPKREPGEGWLAPTTDAVKLKMEAYRRKPWRTKGTENLERLRSSFKNKRENRDR